MGGRSSLRQGSSAAVAEAVRLLAAGGGANVARAAELIDSAAAEGDAAALERQALFHAVGFGRTQDWGAALDCLTKAAEQGSAAAQGQLAALAGDNLPGGAEPCWAQLRRAIRIEDRLAPPPPTRLSDSPRVRSFTGFASPAECGWLIHRGRDRLKPATVYDEATGQLTYASARTNSLAEFHFAQMDVVLELVRARIAAATRLPLPLFEPTQLLSYQVGQEFRPHHDFLDVSKPAYAENIRSFGQRVATVLVYLNEDFEGGETDFPLAHLRFRGRTGDAIFFANVTRDGRPDPSTLHSGLPPTSGEKWLLSQWIRNRPPVAYAG